MIDRPLFDSPPAAKPKRRRAGSKTPTLPVPAKEKPEVWTIRFTGRNGENTAPVVCRIKRLIKSAWRRHQLKAVSVEPMADAGTLGESTAYQSTACLGGPETGCNRAGFVHNSLKTEGFYE